MQRNENESFEAYKARRAESNQAVKNINAASKGASRNTPPPRANRLHKGKISASYGEAIRMFFAQKALEKMEAKKK